MGVIGLLLFEKKKFFLPTNVVLMMSRGMKTRTKLHLNICIEGCRDCFRTETTIEFEPNLDKNRQCRIRIWFAV